VGRQAGGALVVLAGAVLVVAGLRGTLGNVWAALIGAPGDVTATRDPVETGTRDQPDTETSGGGGSGEIFPLKGYPQ